MSGSELYYCLKKGDYEFVLPDLKTYLCSILETAETTRDKSKLKADCEYSVKFLHILVFKFEEVFELEGCLEVMRDCYKVWKLHNSSSTKSGKDAVYAENLLYHLICKLVKKGDLTWACTFSELMYSGLSDIPHKDSSTREQVDDHAWLGYVSLWNAAVALDKTSPAKDKIESIQIQSLHCRVVALKLLGLSDKDLILFADKVGLVISRTKSVISSAAHLKEKYLETICDVVSDSIDLICSRYGSKTGSLDEASRALSQILLGVTKLYLHIEDTDGALSACKKLVENIRLNLPDDKEFLGLSGLMCDICVLSAHTSKQKSCITKLSNSKKANICMDNNIVENLNLKKIEQSSKVLRKFSGAVLPLVTFALELQHTLAQYIHHYKISVKALGFPSEDVLGYFEAIFKNVEKEKITQQLLDVEMSYLRVYYYWLVIPNTGSGSFGCDKALCRIKDLEKKLSSFYQTEQFSLDTHSSFAELTFKFGRHFHFSRLFAAAVSCLEVTCQSLVAIVHQSGSLPNSLKNGRQFAFLADALRHIARAEDGLRCLVQGLLTDPDSLTDIAECWARIKAEVQKTNKDNPVLSRTLYQCCQDSSFPSLSLGGTTKSSPGVSTSLSPRDILESELATLKRYWIAVHPAQLAVIEELCALPEISVDPVEKSWLVLEKLRVYWLSRSNTDSLQELCSDAIRQLEPLLQKRRPGVGEKNCYLEDCLAQAYLWQYIANDVSTTDFLQNLQQNADSTKQTTNSEEQPGGRSSALTGALTSETLSDPANFDSSITVAMETKLQEPINKALELWEGLVSRGDIEKCLKNLEQTAEFVLLTVTIYKLSKKYMHLCRALLVLLKISPKCHLIHLQARTQLIMLFNELRQPHISCDIVLDTNTWLAKIKTETVEQSMQYIEYLMARADRLIISGKAEEGAKALQQALNLRSKHIKSRTKEGLLTDAILQGINTRVTDATGAAPGEYPSTDTTAPSGEDSKPPGEWETKLERLNQATRLVGRVVCSLMGNWMINTSSVSAVDQDKVPNNILDKWELLDRLLTTLYEAGLYAIDVGEAREAACFLIVGLRLSKAFRIPRRLAEFHLAIASLDTVRGRHSDCQAHLHIVDFILDPNSLTKEQPQSLTGRPSDSLPRELHSRSEENGDQSFHIQSQPMNLNDDENDEKSDTEEKLDRSGCASPKTKKKEVTLPENWTHPVNCACSFCEDLVVERITICKLNIDVQRKIYEEDIKEAWSSVKPLLGYFSSLTTKSQTIVKKAAANVMVMMSGNSTGKSSKKVVDENGSKLRVFPSIYQDLIVDMCLQVCNMAVEAGNQSFFDQWMSKFKDQTNLEKYPWMFHKHDAMAEMQYLDIIRNMDDCVDTSTGSKVNGLCVLLGNVRLDDNKQKEYHTPKALNRQRNTVRKSASSSSIISKNGAQDSEPRRINKQLSCSSIKEESTELLSTKADKKINKCLGESPLADSPDMDTINAGVSDLALAPVKAKKGSRAVRLQQRPAPKRPSKTDLPALESPSTVEPIKTRKPSARTTQVNKPKLGNASCILEEPDMIPGTPVNSRTLAPKTPAFMKISNIIRTPVSVCSSRRAVLDLLISSDSEKEELAPKLTARGRKASAKSSTLQKTNPRSRQRSEDAASDKSSLYTTTKSTSRSRSRNNKPNTELKIPVSRQKDSSLHENETILLTEKNTDNKEEIMNGISGQGKASNIAGPFLAMFNNGINSKENKSEMDVFEFECGDSPLAKKNTKSGKGVSKLLKPKKTRTSKANKESVRYATEGNSDSSASLNISGMEFDGSPLFSPFNLLEPSNIMSPPCNISRVHENIEHLCIEEDNSILMDPIEMLRGDVDTTDSQKSGTRVLGRGIKAAKKKPSGKSETSLEEVEEPRKSSVRPLQPNNGVKVKDVRKSEVKTDRRKQNTSPEVPAVLQDPVDSLRQVFESIRQTAPAILYRKVCHSLALALYNSGASAGEIVYYLSEAQAVTFRHKALLSWKSKIRKVDKEENNSGGETQLDLSGSEGVDKRENLCRMRDMLRFNKTPEDLQQSVDLLPTDWRVCQLSVLHTQGRRHKHLIITRFTPQSEPLVLRMPGFSDHTKTEELLLELSSIFTRSSEAIHLTNRSQWWRDRYSLDDDIKNVLEKMEHNWLGCWKGLVFGHLSNSDDETQLSRAATKLVTLWRDVEWDPVKEAQLRLLLNAYFCLSERELIQGISNLCSLSQETPMEELAKNVSSKITNFKDVTKSLNLEVSTRGPVILILDKDIQHITWENMPSLHTQSFTRMPSIYFVSAHYQSLTGNSSSVLQQGIEPHNTYYIVDPDANLPDTKNTFQGWFEKEDGWEGMVHKQPTPQEFQQAISSHDLFIYCGHGSGNKYLSQDSLEMTQCQAASLLMGCSSGKLVASGQLEASGTMLHYFIAGGPCTLGCLWDVTDRDIDRYTEDFLKSWLATGGQAMLDVMKDSRKVCKLRYLTGAAPVAYGLPVHIAEKKKL